MNDDLTGPVPMTLDELAGWLHPPMSRKQLARIINELPGIDPVGSRPTGGRPVLLYDAGVVLDLHTALRRWL